MKNEQKSKKGFFGMLREAFSKSGGCCCGPEETCGGPSEKGNKAETQESQRTQDANRAAQKSR